MDRFLKDSEEELNEWKDTPSLQIKRLNIIKMSILPKLITKFNNPNKNSKKEILF